MNSAESFNTLVAMGAIALQAVTAALLLAYLLEERVSLFKEVIAPVRRYAFAIALLAALGASGMSLFYEYALGVPPCALCWWQRIMMYPQVAFFGFALWTKERATAKAVSIVLSALGLLIGIYNHVLQVYPAGNLPCPSVGVSCAQIFFFEFGYVTFPMLSITFFAFLIVLMLIARSRD